MVVVNRAELHNPVYVHDIGIKILEDNLGKAATALFLQQYSQGKGNYTEERHEWLDGETMAGFKADLQRLRAR